MSVGRAILPPGGGGVERLVEYRGLFQARTANSRQRRQSKLLTVLRRAGRIILAVVPNRRRGPARRVQSHQRRLPAAGYGGEAGLASRRGEDDPEPDERVVRRPQVAVVAIALRIAESRFGLAPKWLIRSHPFREIPGPRAHVDDPRLSPTRTECAPLRPDCRFRVHSRHLGESLFEHDNKPLVPFSPASGVRPSMYPHDKALTLEVPHQRPGGEGHASAQSRRA